MAMLSKLARSHAGKINKAQKWIDHAQLQFDRAIAEAELAERKFDEVANEAQEQIAKLEAEIAEKTAKLKEVIAETEAKKAKAVNFKQKMQTFLD